MAVPEWVLELEEHADAAARSGWPAPHPEYRRDAYPDRCHRCPHAWHGAPCAVNISARNGLSTPCNCQGSAH